MATIALIGGKRMIAGFTGGQVVVVAGHTLGGADLPMVDEAV
mgnify:CR=1 FL=1